MSKINKKENVVKKINSLKLKKVISSSDKEKKFLNLSTIGKFFTLAFIFIVSFSLIFVYIFNIYQNQEEKNANASTILNNGNISSGLNNCSPSPSTINPENTYNCTFDLKSGYQFPLSGSFRATTSTEQNGVIAITNNPAICNYNSNSTTGRLICNNIPAQTTNGIKNILLSYNSSTYTAKGTININNSNSNLITLNNNNINNGLGTCGRKESTLNGKYDCILILKSNYKFPNNPLFQATTHNTNVNTGINSISPNNLQSPINCTVKNNIINCYGIPAGNQNGSKSILIRLGNNTTYTSIGTVNINPATINNTNLNNGLSDCQPSSTPTVNWTYNCSFSLKSGYKFPDSGVFTVATSDNENGITASTTNQTTNCRYTPNSVNTNLVCNNIPAGRTIGNKNILVNYKTQQYYISDTVNKFTIKGRVKINQAELHSTNLRYSLANCQTQSQTVNRNSTYNCTFMIDKNYKFPNLPNLIMARTENTSQDPTSFLGWSVCNYTTGATSGLLTCNNIPAGNGIGRKNILVSYNYNQPFVIKGTINVQ